MKFPSGHQSSPWGTDEYKSMKKATQSKYVCMYVPRQTCMSIYVCVCGYKYVARHAWMYTCVYICRQICMKIYVYVTGLEIGIFNWWANSCVAIRTIRNGHGDAGRCVGVLAWLYCACAGFLLPEEGSRWLWHHLVTSHLCHYAYIESWGYIRGACTNSRLIICVFLAAVHPSYLLRSHWPSVMATSVPLDEWEYNLTGKCSSFVQLHVPKVILGTLSWFDLVVCKLTR